MPTIAIIMEGGLIQSIVSDDPKALPADITIKVIDYDVDGADRDLHVVPQEDGKLAEARVYEIGVSQATIGLDGIEPVDGLELSDEVFPAP